MKALPTFNVFIVLLLVLSSCRPKDDAPPVDTSTNLPAARVRVKLVRITQFPEYKPDSAIWDATDTLPDAYFRVTSTTGTVYWDNVAAVVNQLRTSMLPLGIPIPNPDANTTFVINNLPCKSLYFDFYDKDPGSLGNYIGYCGFDADLYRTLRPTQLHCHHTNNQRLRALVELEWLD
jgi:hypothetical protein